MLVVLLAARAAPVTDAVRVFRPEAYGLTCLERANGMQACWGQAYDRATPIEVMGLPRQVAYTKHEPGDVPRIALPAPPDELVWGWDYTCARMGGRVGCWGADDENQRGDGGGRRLHWDTAQVSDEPAQPSGKCRMRRRVLTCSPDWAGPMAASHAPIRITDVESMVSFDGTTCARRAGGDLVCFGYDGLELMAPRTVAEDVIAFDVAHLGAWVALRADGRVLGHDKTFDLRELSFSLPGATDVHLGGGVACARSPTRFVCLGEYGLAEASRPGGKLGRDANQALCDLDAGVCIDRIRMRGRSLDLTWVEAGW